MITYQGGSYSTQCAVSAVHVLDFGFAAQGTTNVIPPVASSDGGGPNKKHQFANYLTEAEKKRIDQLVAKLEAELHKLPDTAPTTPATKAAVAKIEVKIESYQRQIVKLDPHLGSMIDGLVALAHNKREAENRARQKRLRNVRALTMLLNG